MPKDHKARAEGEPVKTRPDCGTDEANNQQVSQICADICNNVTKIMDPKMACAVTRSTEEMCHGIGEVSKRNNTKNLVIFSMDISGFYPALNIDVHAKVAAEMWYDSEMNLNLDTRELSLYLAVTVERDKLEELGLGDLVMVRKKERGRHPGVTTEEILRRYANTKSLFHEPVRKPTEDEARKMFRLAFEILIKSAMFEHIQYPQLKFGF